MAVIDKRRRTSVLGDVLPIALGAATGGAALPILSAVINRTGSAPTRDAMNLINTVSTISNIGKAASMKKPPVPGSASVGGAIEAGMGATEAGLNASAGAGIANASKLAVPLAAVNAGAEIAKATKAVSPLALSQDEILKRMGLGQYRSYA